MLPFIEHLLLHISGYYLCSRFCPWTLCSVEVPKEAGCWQKGRLFFFCISPFNLKWSCREEGFFWQISLPFPWGQKELPLRSEGMSPKNVPSSCCTLNSGCSIKVCRMNHDASSHFIISFGGQATDWWSPIFMQSLSHELAAALPCVRHIVYSSSCQLEYRICTSQEGGCPVFLILRNLLLLLLYKQYPDLWSAGFIWSQGSSDSSSSHQFPRLWGGSVICCHVGTCTGIVLIQHLTM